MISCRVRLFILAKPHSANNLSVLVHFDLDSHKSPSSFPVFKFTSRIFIQQQLIAELSSISFITFTARKSSNSSPFGGSTSTAAAVTGGD